MSGAQGALPKGSHMATTYEMAKDPKDPQHYPHAREDPRHSTGDSPSVPVVFEEPSPTETSPTADQSQLQPQQSSETKDLGVTGTA